jgi:4-diphosphocytidyl-2-C-methyl-D-erythritol kinase
VKQASTPRRVRIQAAAKVNLTLKVIGRRSDGYHLLDGLVVFAGIGDNLDIALAPQFSLNIAGPFGEAIGPVGDNLLYKAAHGLAVLLGRAPKIEIDLEKNLPVAAGLGGGSSDAAALMRALIALWQSSVGQSDIDALALSLGADVPVCLHARPVFMSGIGEVLAPAPDLPEVHLVLANPGIGLSSANVFAHRSGPFTTAERFFGVPASAAALAARLRDTENDLTKPACFLAPEITTVIDLIGGTQGCLLARMSGSGPTCFGLYPSAADADRAAVTLSRENPRWWIRAGPMLAAPPPVIPLENLNPI